MCTMGTHNYITLKKKVSQYLLYKLTNPVFVIYLHANVLLGEPKTLLTAFITDYRPQIVMFSNVCFACL